MRRLFQVWEQEGFAEQLGELPLLDTAATWNPAPRSPTPARGGVAMVVMAAAVFGPPLSAGGAPPADIQLIAPTASPAPVRSTALPVSSIAGPIAADPAAAPSDPPLVVASPTPARLPLVPRGLVVGPPYIEGPSGNDLRSPTLSPPPTRPRLPVVGLVAAPLPEPDRLIAPVASPAPAMPRGAPRGDVFAPWRTEGPSGTDTPPAVVSPLLAPRRALPVATAFAPPDADAAVATAVQLAVASPAPVRGPGRPLSLAVGPIAADAPQAPSEGSFVASPMRWRRRPPIVQLQAFAPITEGTSYVPPMSESVWLGRILASTSQRYRGALADSPYRGGLTVNEWHGIAAADDYSGAAAHVSYRGGATAGAWLGRIAESPYRGSIDLEGDEMFNLVVGDRSPSLTATLTNAETGAAVNLTTASGVSFKWKLGSSGAVTTESATVVTAASGIVRFDWSVNSTASAGVLYCRFVATFPTALPQTFPSDGTWLEIPVHAAT